MEADGTPQSSRLAAQLMLLSYRRTQCLGVAAELRLFDRLDLEPKTADELAHECGADSRSLRRPVRALLAMDLLLEDEEGRLGAAPIWTYVASYQLAPLAR